MPIDPNFTPIFSHVRRIDFTQCLPSGFLRYTDLCNILQLTAGEHAEMGGISFSDMQRHDQAWVLSRMRVEILGLPKWKDVVTIKTWIVNLENSRSVRALEMYLGDRKIVGCETFWAVFNTHTRRPEALAIPSGHFGQFPDRLPTACPSKRIDPQKKMTASGSRNVMVSDLDIVNHVNNVKYLEWCLDCLDAPLLLSGKIKSIDMNFMKELVLDDAVEIVSSRTDTGATFAVTKNAKACFALEIGF